MNDITLLTLLSATFTFIIILLKQLYKSKCNNIDCFCIRINRNIKTETEEHKFDIEHNVKDTDIEIIKSKL